MRPFLARWGGCLLEALLIFVIGFVVYQLIRIHLCERYRIPTPSMEPTLHGDPASGDLVLVNKTSWWGRRPQPFDMVVFRSAITGEHHIVKRLAALGTCDVRLERGDLWISRSGGPLQRVHKDPVEHRDLRVDLFRHLCGPCLQTFEEFFHLPAPGGGLTQKGVIRLAPAYATPAGVLTGLKPALRRAAGTGMAPFLQGFMATYKGLDDSFLGPTGKRRWEGQHYYADIGLEMELTALPGVTALVFVHEYRDHDVALIWERSGALRLIVDGEARAATAGAPIGEAAMRLSFGYLDGRIFLVRDGVTLLLSEVTLPRHRKAKRVNGLQFGVCGTAGVSITSLRVFRDLAATPVGGAYGRGDGTYHVPAGSMFLLGDNGHDSADSRSNLRMVPLERLIGRPMGILRPLTRARVFAR